MNKPTPGPWKNPGGNYRITGPGCAWRFRMTCDMESMRKGAEKDGIMIVGFGGLNPGVDALLALLPKEENGEANAALIVAAVNACFAISPSNPLAVAEALPGLVEAARASESFLQDLVGRPRIGSDLEPTLARLRATLAKLEAK